MFFTLYWGMFWNAKEWSINYLLNILIIGNYRESQGKFNKPPASCAGDAVPYEG
jgi:hypothetical protein